LIVALSPCRSFKTYLIAAVIGCFAAKTHQTPILQLIVVRVLTALVAIWMTEKWVKEGCMTRITLEKELEP